MTIEILRDALLWSSVINLGLMLFSFFMLSVNRQWVYSIHSKWIPLTEPQFNALIYGLLGLYKVLIFMFNIVPYIALCIAS